MAEGERSRSARASLLLLCVAVAAGVGYLVQLAVKGSSPKANADASLHVGNSVPSSLTPLDMAFVSLSRGYELVKNASGTYLAATANGGALWTVASGAFKSSRPGPPSRSGPHFPSIPSGAAVGVMSDGAVYLYGVSASLAEVSTNGGRTWHTYGLPGTVEDITSTGSTLTALVDGPQPKGTRTNLVPPPPAGWLYSSSDNGTSWHRVSTLPADIGPYKLLVQQSPGIVYVLAPGENNTNDGVYGGLVRTTDEGRTWTVGQSPCDVDAAPRFGADAQFGATPNGTLWLVCGDSLSRGFGNISQVETSQNGEDWTLVAGTQDVAQYGHWNFPATASVPVARPTATSVFTSASTWLVLNGPARLLRTTDGGDTWTDGAPSAVEKEGPLFVEDVDGRIDVRTTTHLWQLDGSRWRVLS